MLKIDIHTHILPRNWPDLREKYGEVAFPRIDHQASGCAHMMIDGEGCREIHANCWDPEVRLRECAQNQVDVQVLSTVPIMFSYWAEPRAALDFSGFLNDHIAAVVEQYPRRFVGLGTLPMQAPKLAIRELERCTRELGLAGVEIGSHVNDWNLNAPEVYAVFEAAQDLDAAIFVHPWDMLGRERMQKYWMPWLVGMPAETCLAICSMIFGGVFECLPRLRVAFAHGGGSFPGTIGRIAHGFRVRPDLCAIDTERNPRDYVGHFYVDSLVHEADILQSMIDLLGVESIALGSDYPFPLGETRPGELIESMSLQPAVGARLMHGTALEWLRLDQSGFL